MTSSDPLRAVAPAEPPPPGPAILALRAAARTYRSGDRDLPVLRAVDLALTPDTTLAIQGPSGSGKSTLLNLLAALDEPTSGALHIDGSPATSYDDEALSAWRRRHLGFIFQDFRLLPRLTALENAALPLELLGAPWAEAAERAGALLTRLGLGERTGHFPDQLSGGEQQRCAIARAFIHAPSVVLADEPTGNLDPTTSTGVLDALLQIRADSGAALVVVTHDAEVAARMQRTVRIEQGEVHVDGA